MTDITKCMNEKCEKRLKCWRYLATFNMVFQSIADFPGGELCTGWWDMGGEAKKTRRIRKYPSCKICGRKAYGGTYGDDWCWYCYTGTDYKYPERKGGVKRKPAEEKREDVQDTKDGKS